jgi:hypothetical protein
MECRDCGKLCGAGLCVDCFLIQVKATPSDPSHIKENRFTGAMIEYGAIAALFENEPMSEVCACSSAQSAFDAGQAFIKSMTEHQCKLAGCTIKGKPYHEGDHHTDRCWYTHRVNYYRGLSNLPPVTEFEISV